MNNQSNFYNKRSVSAVKASNNNAPFQVGKGQKEGIFAFSCGNTEGLVSQKAMAHLRGGGDINKCVVADIDYTDHNGNPASCTMLMIATTGISAVEFTF